jgi:AraC-like DNA-binding protein
MPKIHRQRQGFIGEHVVVVPQSVIQQMQREPMLCELFVTDAGCFPEARGHFVERCEGTPGLILIVCLSGCGWVRLLNGDRYSVQADEAFLIPPDAPHAYGSDDTLPWTIMWAHFRGGDSVHFQNLLKIVPSGSPLIHLPAGTASRLEFSTIYETLESGYTLANLLSSAAKLRFVLSEFNRLRLPGHPQAHPAEQGVRQSIEWMQRNLHREASLDELAREAGISVSHFSAIFKRRTGFAPINYFLRLKISNACRLLDTTSMEIKEVASAAGFEDPFYFSRFFKKIMGHSPRSYRSIQKG